MASIRSYFYLDWYNSRNGYSSKSIITDDGEVREAEVFVATLGAYITPMLKPSRAKKSYWLEAHANAFEHFGGIPQLLVPDNLRSAVTKANRYEPRLNDSYQKLA